MLIQKRFVLLMVTLITVVVFYSGCAWAETEKDGYKPGDDVTSQVEEWIDHIKNSETYETAWEWFDPALDEECARQVFSNVKDLTLKNLKAVFCGLIDGKAIVHLAYENQDGPYAEVIQFEIETGNFRYCNDESVWERVNNEMICPSCGGSGQIMDGTGTACAICGGTGQQYIPNLYFDAVMGWTGGYIGCSGCGGSGYIGNVSYHVCENCHGIGLVF